MAEFQYGWSLNCLQDLVRGAIQAATLDDVHKSAVVAIEALGTIITVHPMLIGKAVDTLGGTRHIGLELFRRRAGDLSGGLEITIRNSASATRCFLLITGLKLYLSNEEVAEVLYQMMAKASILETASVSQAQLVSLITIIEPQAKLLLSKEQISNAIVLPTTEHLSKLNPETPASRNGTQLFETLPAPKLAILLISVFTAIKTLKTSSVELYGRVGGIWLASLFSWLLPEDTRVVIEKVPIFGQYGERFVFINLDITTSPLEQWHWKEFQGKAHLQSIFWDGGKVSIGVVKALVPVPLGRVGGALLNQMGPKTMGIVGNTAQGKGSSFLPWT